MAWSQALECQGVTINTKAVALATPLTRASENFTGSFGQLDPIPLLQTDINVLGLPGRASCVTVTFSAQADPSDNYAVYQASIDDVPMSGHGSLFNVYGYTTPIVFDEVNQGTFLTVAPYQYPNGANSRFVSYTFFAPVMPGVHTIRIRLAGCCSLVTPGTSIYVRAATVVGRY